MPFVQAKCPECGGILAVDNDQKAAICQFCGKPYIVEEAVNNYITYNVTNNVTNQNFGEGAVVHIHEEGTKDSVSALLERAFMFLEDGDWKSVDNYCEKALDLEPRCAEAYLGKLLADLELNREAQLAHVKVNFGHNKNYLKIIQFGDDALKTRLKGYLEKVKVRLNIQGQIESATKAEIREKELAEQEAKRRQAEEKKRLEAEKKARIASEIKQKREKIAIVQNVLARGNYHTVGVKSDGSVIAVGDNKFGQCNVSSWYDIIAVAVGDEHTVGLKSDGTVVVAGYGGEGLREAAKWTDIIAICAGRTHTVGLKSDGTVVAVGDNKYGQCKVSYWRNIIAISADGLHTVGLKADGTVVAVGGDIPIQLDISIQRDIYHWKDIVAISAGGFSVVGLKSDGTAICNKKNTVSHWNGIVAVSEIVGLKYDGTVVDSFNKIIPNWSDIIAIAGGGKRIVGLKSDGTVVAIDDSDKGEIRVSQWRLFDNFENLQEERKTKMAERKIVAEKGAQYRSKGLCQHCGGELKGLFGKKCAECGKPKDY